MTTRNGPNWRSPKVRILQPPLDRFQVRKLELWTLPRTLGALAKRSHPLSAGFGDCLPTDDLQGCLLAVRKLGGEPVSLQSLLARKPARLSLLRPARAWAAPTLLKVALAVLRTRMRVIEGLQAGADAAVQVLLGDPSLTRGLAGLGLVRLFFFGLVRVGWRI
jgi:hypothetical protein